MSASLPWDRATDRADRREAWLCWGEALSLGGGGLALGGLVSAWGVGEGVGLVGLEGSVRCFLGLGEGARSAWYWGWWAATLSSLLAMVLTSSERGERRSTTVWLKAR